MTYRIGYAKCKNCGKKRLRLCGFTNKYIWKCDSCKKSEKYIL